MKSKCEDLTKKFSANSTTKGKIPPRFRRTKLQRRAHLKQIQLKKDQVNGKVAEGNCSCKNNLKKNEPVNSHRNCRLTTRYWIFALERSKLCKDLHGSGVYTSPYEIGTVQVKKLTCFFQVPNLHTLPLKNSSSSAGPV